MHTLPAACTSVLSSADQVRACEHAIELKRLEYTVQFCSLALLYFDYLLTLGDEVKYIWMEKWRKPTILYFMCRYSLVANLLYFLSISEEVTGLNCDAGYIICGVLSIVGHAGIVSVWTARTCAVYNNSKIVAGFLGTIGGTVLILLMIRTPFIRCLPVYQPLPGFRGAISALMLFFDVASFVLATVRVWKSARESKVLLSQGAGTYSRVLFSQGFFYIGGVAALSISSLVLNFKAWSGGIVVRILNGLKLPLSGFLTARFILALRACNSPATHDDDDYPDPSINLTYLGSLPRVPNLEAPQESQLAQTSSILSELGRDLHPQQSRISDSDDEDQEPAQGISDERRRARMGVQGCNTPDVELGLESESNVSPPSLGEWSSSGSSPPNIREGQSLSAPINSSPSRSSWIGPGSASLRSRYSKSGHSSIN
ncbi:hypothetical protein FA15DRAFT_756834 [Coprinopsis marcescibilis]|uniref:DUF6533 domain-containing protein n=1 Tax=Coprinopsis marcescibilis TaxID=230819 RepID=A0A5C3L6Y5_COPMA|nr:hypothetical protein FA15DRAFT_756834 [Coprinopsis marcescibilis]